MKTKLLTAAIAVATLSSATSVMADGITTALANGTISGEAYGGYRTGTIEDQDNELGLGSTDSDFSDGDIDKLRLGFNAQIMENVEFGIEAEWNAGDHADESSTTTIRDLYIAKTYGDTVVTAGRFKQIADRTAAIEESDSIIAESALDAGVAAFADQVLSGAPASFTLDVAEFIGEIRWELAPSATRRVDGIEVKHANASGLNGSLAFYKGGVDSSGADMERNWGYSGSIGWQGSADDIQFGVTLAAYQEDSDESDAIAYESSGFSATVNADFGLAVAILGYSDNEIESENGASADASQDGFNAQVAVDLGGAARNFDKYGVLGAPELAANEWGFEFGLTYSQIEHENDGYSGALLGGTFDADLDQLGVGINAYHGLNKKVYLQYVDGELDFDGGGSVEVDQILLGGRIDF